MLCFFRNEAAGYVSGIFFIFGVIFAVVRVPPDEISQVSLLYDMNMGTQHPSKITDEGIAC